MPFIRFHYTETSKIASVSRLLTDRVQQMVGCPRENIVLEVLHSDVVSDGEVKIGDWPFVEVHYFERPVEIQDQVAKIISECLTMVGYTSSDVYFCYLKPENYYENGVCYK